MNKEFEILSRAVIINGDKVLLANVRGKKWFFLPGGHVEFGETATDALRRELDEETTGSVFSIGEPIGFFENIYGDDASSRHQEYTILFAVTASVPDAIVSREEKLEFTFHKIANLQNMDIRPKFLADALTDWHNNQTKLLSVER